MWEGRGGTANAPLGTDVVNLPPGPSIAVLESPDAPWPKAKDRNARNVGATFRGYRLDKQRQPIFLYRVGPIDVEEQPLPVLKENGTALSRRFVLEVKGATPPAGVYGEVAAGTKIELGAAAGEWRVDDKLTVRVKSENNSVPVVREKGGSRQLLLPVKFDAGGKTSFEVETTW
jgi:hypothetical protein